MYSTKTSEKKDCTYDQNKTLSCIEKWWWKKILFFLKISITLHASFAAFRHLAEGLCPSALLMFVVDNSLIFLVGTRIPTLILMEWQFILPLKTWTWNRGSRCHLELSAPKFKYFKIKSSWRKISNWKELPWRKLANFLFFYFIVVSKCKII
jgi:hypothetical protein